MSEDPRENKLMLSRVTRKYEKALYMGDRGMWTINETTTRPIAQAPSAEAADRLIERLMLADKAEKL